MSKLRILCLHGFTSNGAVHAHQLRRITSQLPEYEFLFPDGPHQVNIKDQMDMTQPMNQVWSEVVLGSGTAGHRAWWFARDGDWKSKTTGGFIGLEESLDYLGTYLSERGPVHAVWGFSQGACFAGMLCGLFQQKLVDHPLRKHFPTQTVTTPRAGVIFSGFRARFPQYDNLYEQGIDVPMLHVLGEKDPLVRSERSEALIHACQKSESLKHAGGHDIPKNGDEVQRIVDFTRRHVKSEEEPALQASI
jgi:predicted esterase